MNYQELFLWTVTAIITVCLLAFVCIKWKYGFWRRLGIPYDRPSFLYGSLKGMGHDFTLGGKMKKLYDEYRPAKVFGMFLLFEPLPVICDLDLIKAVLIRDFHQLSDRGLYWNEKDTLSANLVNLPEDRWRALRSKLSPAFSSGKLSVMMPIVDALTDKLVEIIRRRKGENVNTKDLFSRYTTDVIVNCAFGLDCNTLDNENEEFIEKGYLVFTRSARQALKILFKQSFPNFSRFLNLGSVGSVLHNFFYNLMKETVEYREREKVQRGDFLDILLKMKSNSELTFDQVAAQVLVFHLAGFETSATTITFSCYELAMNQEVQERARREIQSVMREFNNEFTYEAIFNMPYMDQVINESLRKYPPGPLLWRRVAADRYQIPGTNVVLMKDDQIAVPVYGIHRDPEIYPDPEKFDPDRFLPENVGKRHPMAFLAFGGGPRNCIGIRFAIMEIKVALVKILLNYRLEKSDDLPDPIPFATTGIIIKPRDDLHLQFTKLD